MSSIIQHFPSDFTPNESQVEISTGIDRAIANGKKFIIIQAPTGAGKTIVSKMMANAAPSIPDDYRKAALSYKVFTDGYNMSKRGGCYALTVTKQLQDQYVDIFKREVNMLKGKSNYCCDVDPEMRADVAPCIITPGLKKECFAKNRCMYYRSRNWAISSQFTVLNYDMFFNLPPQAQERSVIVCDEASELEKVIVSNHTITINYKKIRKLGIKLLHAPKTHDARLSWINGIATSCDVRMAELIAQARQSVSETDKRTIQTKIGQLATIRNSATQVATNWSRTEFVFEDGRNGEEDFTTVAPLHIDFLSDSIFSKADTIVLMSATFIDVPSYAKRLGISDYEYIEVESRFDPAKSPIYLSTQNFLKRDNIEVEIPKIAKLINEICKHHKGEKGIIHTHNMQITRILQERLTDRRFLFRDDDYTNADILTEHYESDEPTVLVSPSMTHGTDLKDEYARFQIIVKAPYPPLANERIKRLFELDKQWYVNEMLSTIIQASGRGTRHVDDHCVTYILDGCASTILSKSLHVLPKCFKARIK